MKFSTKYLTPLGFLLLFYIIWSVGIDKLSSALNNLNIFYLFIALFLMGISVIIKIKKWQEIVKTQDKNFSFKEGIIFWLIGLFAATITPGRIGDFAKVFYLKRISFGKAFSTVFLERIIDLVVLFSLGTLGVLITVFLFASDLTTIITLIFFIIFGLVFLYLLTKRNFARIIARPIYNHMVPEKYKEKLSSGFIDTYKGVRQIKDDKKKVIYLFLLAYLSWLILFGSAFFVAKSVGINIDFIYIVAFLSIADIVGLAPITMSGFGTREATLIFFFGFLGISASSTVIFSLLYVFSGWLFSFVGLIFWIKKPLKISL